MESPLKLKFIDSAIITLFLAAIFYATGWSYAYEYFSHFHIGLLGLSISKEYFFLYSFWAIRNQWMEFSFLLLLLFFLPIAKNLLLFLREKMRPKTKQSEKDFSFFKGLSLTVFLILVILSVFFTFLFCVWLGERAAYLDYKNQDKNDFPSYPRVKVLIKAENASELAPYAEEWKSGCYRLLLRTQGNVYIFYSSRFADKTATHIIPENKIELLQILPFYKSCNG